MFMEHSSPVQNVWQQLKWKLKVHQGKMFALLFIQLFFIFTVGSSRGYHMFDIDAIRGEYLIPSLDAYAVAGTIYMFIVAIYLGMSATLHENFSIPTTRTLSNVSNGLYLLIVSCVTTVVSYSSLYISVAFQSIFHREETLIDVSQSFSLSHFISFLILMWLVSAVGYLLASLFQIRSWLGVLAIVMSWIIFRTELLFVESAFEQLITGGVVMFSVKCLIVTMGLYAIVFVATDRLEVK